MNLAPERASRSPCDRLVIHYITTNGIGNATVWKELQWISSAGIPWKLHALRREEEIHFASSEVRAVNRDTATIYPISPLALLLAMVAAPLRFRRQWWSAAANALFGERESLQARFRAIGHFIVACHWANGLRREPVARIHSQWIHSAGTVGMYGAWLLGVPFSFTGHAADLFRDRVALRDKIRRADRIVCISNFHRTIYLTEGADPSKLVLVYAAIDCEHFRPAPAAAAGLQTILSAGRLIEKKGFDDLIRACGLLRRRGVEFRCVIAGSGPLERVLRDLVRSEGLGDIVEITGTPLLQETIPEFMASGTIFCLPCVPALDGDIDGLPQLLMESLACGVPSISTNLVGIPELIVHERTGLLVEPRDVPALADAIDRLLGNSELRNRIKTAGLAWVRERFEVRRCVQPLLEIFRASLAAIGSPSADRLATDDACDADRSCSSNADPSSARGAGSMIHYITTNGIGNAWVGNELHRVGGEGIPFQLHALYRDEQNFFASEWAELLDEETNYIYPLPWWRAAGSLVAAPFRFGGRFWSAFGNALVGERESLMNRLKGLGHLTVACAWAGPLRHGPPARIHSHWIHSCGTVGMYGAWLLGVPFSFTGHAADLFRDRVALRDKIRRADRIVCISEFHRAFYISEGADPAKLFVVYCGIDTSHFRPVARPAIEGPVRIRSAGRLVEKKGFADLIKACGILRDRGLDFECVIGGSGPLEGSLRDLIDSLRLGDRVRITGAALKQEEIPEFMRDADLFCLPCVWASDNDVDGLPQMLMEAMACGLPSISTRLVGIPDLVRHDESGVLVEPGDTTAIADAISRLAADDALRRRLAAGGRQRVIEAFDLRTCLAPLFEMHQESIAAQTQRRRRPPQSQLPAVASATSQ